MISKQRAYDFMASHKSRYEYMIDSLMIEDRANAEVCRLGSFAWQEICALISNTSVTEFDMAVESVIANMIAQWEKYLETGIPQNSVQDMTSDTVRLHQERRLNGSIYSDPYGVNPPEPAQPEKIPDVTLPDSTNPVDSSRQKKGKQKVTLPSKPKEPEAPPVDSELLSYVNRDGINAVVDEIRQEVLGVDDSWAQELAKRAAEAPAIAIINE